MRHALVYMIKGVQLALRDPYVRGLMGLTLSMIAVASIVYRWVEGWRWLDAIYFSVITLATVGYGDFSPQTDTGKIFTIIYIFSGLGLFVATATAFANRMIQVRDPATNDKDNEGHNV